MQNKRARWIFYVKGAWKSDVRILRIPVDGRPISIIDISAVPSEITNVVVSLICRLVFDFAVRGDHGLERRFPSHAR